MGTRRRLHYRKLTNRDPEDDLHLRDVARFHRHGLDRFQACHQRCVQDTARRDAGPGWTTVFCDFVSLRQTLEVNSVLMYLDSADSPRTPLPWYVDLYQSKLVSFLTDGGYVDLHDAQPQCCDGCYC